MPEGHPHGHPPGGRTPRDPRAFLQLAEEHRRNGRLKEAIAVCIEGLGRHPGLDAVRVTLGRAYLESDQLEMARQTLDEVFTRLPEHHLAGKLLAEAQKRLGDRAAAESTGRALLEHYPRDREIEAILESVGAPKAEGAETPGAARAAVAPRPATVGGDPEPEYLPEDVNLASTPAPKSARPSTAAPQAPVVPKTPPALPTPSPAPKAAASPAPPARPAAPPAASASSVAPTRATPAAAPRAPAASAAPPPPPAPTRGDVLQTGTLADLYLRQGLVDRAIEVYKAMLRVDPANERARQRLAEIESGVPQTGLPATGRTGHAEPAQPFIAGATGMHPPAPNPR